MTTRNLLLTSFAAAASAGCTFGPPVDYSSCPYDPAQYQTGLPITTLSLYTHAEHASCGSVSLANAPVFYSGAENPATAADSNLGLRNCITECEVTFGCAGVDYAFWDGLGAQYRQCTGFLGAEGATCGTPANPYLHTAQTAGHVFYKRHLPVGGVSPPPPPAYNNACSAPCDGTTCSAFAGTNCDEVTANHGCDCAGCCVSDPAGDLQPPPPSPPPLRTYTLGWFAADANGCTGTTHQVVVNTTECVAFPSSVTAMPDMSAVTRVYPYVGVHNHPARMARPGQVQMCFGETKEVCEDMVTVGTSSVRGYTGHCMDAALDDGQCAIVTMPVSGYQPFLKVTLAGSDDVSPDKTPPIKCDPDDKVCNEINKALDAAVGLGIGMLILLIGGSITLVIILIITIYCCCKGKCPCWKRNRAAPQAGANPFGAQLSTVAADSGTYTPPPPPTFTTSSGMTDPAANIVSQGGGKAAPANPFFAGDRL